MTADTPLQRAVPCQITWRDAKYSDWTCYISGERYQVHRQVLASKSFFFAGAFAGQYSEGKALTDLTDVIPVEAHGAFTCALDDFYEVLGSEAVSPENSAALWVISDILQCGGLKMRIEEYMQELVHSWPDGFQLFLKAALLCPSTAPLVEKAMSIVPSTAIEGSVATILAAPLASVSRETALKALGFRASRHVWIDWDRMCVSYAATPSNRLPDERCFTGSAAQPSSRLSCFTGADWESGDFSPSWNLRVCVALANLHVGLIIGCGAQAVTATLCADEEAFRVTTGSYRSLGGRWNSPPGAPPPGAPMGLCRYKKVAIVDDDAISVQYVAAESAVRIKVGGKGKHTTTLVCQLRP